MPRLTEVWSSLSLQRQVVAVLAALAVIVSVASLARMAAQPSMALLFSGLEPGSAGAVIGALEQRGVPHEIRGDAIFVAASQRDSLRLTLASEGLPSPGTQGYELLEGLSGFGTTAQMFDAAYWRAKEGELARTIQASPQIAAARVHIAHPGESPFARGPAPSASVALTPVGGTLGAGQAKAVRHLVAAAVSGLSPERVTVIDGNGSRIAGVDDAEVSAGSATRAEALRQRVERLLEARVGAGNAVVEVSVDTVTETETILERRIDPDSRVAISTDSEERSETARGTSGGQVTVASNLPDGDAAAADQSSSQNSETRERVNYEVSETQREITRAPGAIRRITVAVLVNGTTRTDASGTPVFVPRPEEELNALRDLVASAVGFDEARGDVITLRSLAFEPAEPPGTEAIAPAWSWPALDVMSLIQAAVLGLVSLLLGLFVLRPILRQPPQEPSALAPASATASVPATANAPGPALTGEIDDGTADPDSMSVVGSDRATAFGALSARGEEAADPVTRLRALIADRQEETVEILRNWLDDRERAE